MSSVPQSEQPTQDNSPQQTPGGDLSQANLPQTPANSEKESGQVPRPSDGATTAPARIEIATYDAQHVPDAQVAVKIAEFFARVYGDVHNRPILKDPERYIEEVRAGKLISFVGQAEDKVVVHAALVSLGENVMELDLGLIDPATRGHKVGNAVWDMAMSVLHELHRRGEVDVMRADCVTSHPITQKYADQHGSRIAGIFDRKYCDFFKTDRHESVVRLDLLLNQDIKKEREVFLPPSLQVIASMIYERQGCARSIRGNYAGLDYRPVSPASVQRSEYEMQAFQAAMLTVSPGVTPYQLVNEIDSASKQGIKHLSVRVEIGHPGALDQVNALKSQGFYFAALELKREKDFLVMQRLNQPGDKLCCPHDMKLYHEDSRILLNLIRASQLS